MVWKRLSQTTPKEKELPELPPMPKPEPKLKQKEIIEVVAKLPVQEVRKYQREDGTIVNLMTIEEALTEFMNAGAE